jgi:hypothetical protein
VGPELTQSDDLLVVHPFIIQIVRSSVIGVIGNDREIADAYNIVRNNDILNRLGERMQSILHIPIKS